MEEIQQEQQAEPRRMKLAYVAGKYRSKTEYGVHDNIQRAEKVALRYWARGYAVICPHKNTAYFGGFAGLNDSVWLDGDLEMVRRCDVVIMMPDWEDSVGACTELAVAKAYGKEIIYDDSDLYW